MKKITMFLTIGATVALLAMPVAATTLITVNDEAVQDQCTAESKNALYQDFLKYRKDDQAKAFDDAKKYLACPTAEVTEDQQKIIDYLKKWSTAYDVGMRKVNFTKLLYTDKKYPEAYTMGREILASDPENLRVLVDLGANGYVVAPLKNQQLNTESLQYAQKALQLIDSGKALDDWTPLASKDAAVAYLNFTVGTLTLEKDPANALKNLIKAAQFETPLKKSPYTYAYIAAAYETGPYAKQSEQYKSMYGGKDETPESKLALANINQLVDRMIDGYARAVALAGSDAQYATQKPVWLESLTTWYKYLHNNSDTGMNEMVAGIVAKPLPPEPTPLTSLPTAAPTATPIGTSGAAPANGNGTPGTAAPAGTTQPASKASTTPAASTSSKPAGTKPPTNPDRPRN
jgi:tetratricopeptide (TPR) repeat protein